MRAPQLLVCVALSSILSVPVSAQQSTSTAPATSDPQAVALLQQSLAALTGGIPVTDVTMAGTVTVNQGTGTASGAITMVATSTGQSQITVNLSSGRWVTTADYSTNPRTSVTTGPGGAVHDSTPEELNGPSPAWFFPALLVSAVSPASYIASYLGDNAQNGSTLHHIWIRSTSPGGTYSFQSIGRQILTNSGPQPPVRAGQLELYVDSSSLPQMAVLGVTSYMEKKWQCRLNSSCREQRSNSILRLSFGAGPTCPVPHGCGHRSIAHHADTGVIRNYQ